MSDQSEGTLKNLGVFSTLQAATKVKFFLLSASFILLVDNVFIKLRQPGIYELMTKKEVLEASNLPLKAIMIFVAFSFLTSMILPVLALIFDDILRLTIGNAQIAIDSFVNRLFGIEDVLYERENNSVLLGELQRKAHESKESYYINLYEKHSKLNKEARVDRVDFTMYSFYCLFMLSINYYLGYSDEGAASMVVEKYFGSSIVIWYSMISLVVMIGYRFFKSYRPEWIYCLSLYEEIKEKKIW